MSFEKYEVMSEFLKIAEKQNLLGLTKTAAPEENPHKEDKKVIEEKRQKSPEKSIIEIAHPEPVYVAEARGDGGLVENQIEQQKKLIEMINKMPTGTLVGRYASAALELIKVANTCDDIGETDAADLLTIAAQDLFSRGWEEDIRRDFEDDLVCPKCGDVTGVPCETCANNDIYETIHDQEAMYEDGFFEELEKLKEKFKKEEAEGEDDSPFG